MLEYESPHPIGTLLGICLTKKLQISFPLFDVTNKVKKNGSITNKKKLSIIQIVFFFHLQNVPSISVSHLLIYLTHVFISPTTFSETKLFFFKIIV